MGYDLAMIGSGGGAFAAGIAARRRGLSVVMIERDMIGGTCVNTGCVPSKALLAAAERRHRAADSRFPGITTAAGPVDVGALIGGKIDLVEQLRKDKYTDLAADYDWPIVAGSARFAASDSGPVLDVELNDGGHTRIEAAHYLVATGSAPWAPPIDGLAGAGYLTSTTAMELSELPESMIVIGGNAIGLEQGQLFARLGVRVTIVEALDRLAPFEEPEISQVIEGVFADEGIGVYTAATITRVDGDIEGYRVAVAGRDGAPRRLHAEQLLVATGRRPVTAGLNLDAVGVTTGQRGEIVVDDQLRTTHPRVWAAGDVTAAPQFVYVAAAHGSMIVDNAFGDAGRAVEYTLLPRVTFTSPAIASVGLTDTQAVAAGHACQCRVLPLEYVPRALVARDTRGLVKLVAERGSGRLLGAHIIADGAGEVIQAALYALRAGMSVYDLANTWAPYLTMAEALKLAAQTFTTDVTKLSCCAA